MDKIWLIVIFLVCLFFIGCMALFVNKSQRSFPKVIITIVDNHGNIEVHEIRNITALKVVTALEVDYAHEYMPIIDVDLDHEAVGR